MAAKCRSARGTNENIECATCPLIVEWLEQEADKMSKTKKKMITCVKCGKVAPHTGRGMCGRCYNFDLKQRKAGTKPEAEKLLAAVESTPATAPTKPVSYSFECEQRPESPHNNILFCRINELEKENAQLRQWVDRLTKAVAA
jgi:ribosomal protein S27AE